jgi:hypothetical protein
MFARKNLWLSMGAAGLAGLFAFGPVSAEEAKKPAPKPDPRKMIIERPVKALAADPRAELLEAAEKARAAERKAAVATERAKSTPMPGAPLAAPASSTAEWTAVAAPKAAESKSAAAKSVGENPTVEPGLVKWHTDFAAACKAAEKSGKPVLLFQMLGRMDRHFC